MKKGITRAFAIPRAVGFGMIMIAAGLVLIWSQQANEHLFKPLNDTVASAIRKADGAVINSAFNQKPIIVSATLESSAPLEDELLKPVGYVFLRRNVEMYQWYETASSSAEENNLQKASYRLGWVTGQVDFFTFKEPAGHENPLLKFSSRELTSEHLSFGAYDGSSLVRQMAPLPALKLTKELLKDSSLQIVDNKIFIKRDPQSINTTPQLGDMRVWYEGVPKGEYTVLAIQSDNGVLEPGSIVGGGSFFVIRPGHIALELMLESLGGRSNTASWKIWILGNILIFFGFISILGPFSDRISLRPYLEMEGVKGALILSLFLTLVLAAAMFVVGFL